MALPPGLPEHSLGWGVLQWCSKYLAQPDGDGKGQRWVFTDEQAEFVVWFYAIDSAGKFLYRRAVLERSKGWGKSPLLAALCCAELLGPVKFSHFDRNGNAVGRTQPSAFVQIAAISEDQTDNTMLLVGEMLADGEAFEAYQLKGRIGLTQVIASGKRKLMRVTASYRSREGNRPTFVVMDETHLWTENAGGLKLAEVLRRNLAKTGGRSIETTNAPLPGEGSVAEMSHDYFEMMQAGTAFDDSLLFDSREVIIEDIYDKEQAIPALRIMYGDAVWIDLDRIWAEINDPATKEHDARRFYFNQRVQGYSQWIKEAVWDKCRREDLKLRKGDKVALGFVGTTRNSAAALVACRLADGALFLVGLWEKPDNAGKDWKVPVSEIITRVKKWMNQDRTYYLVANGWKWQDIIEKWSNKYPDEVEEVFLSQPLLHTKLVDDFEEAVHGERLTHPGDVNLTRHVMNTHTEETTQGYITRPETPHSKRYIAAAQAALLAWRSAQVAIENGALDEVDNSIYGW